MGARVLGSIVPVCFAVLGVVIANLPIAFFGGQVPPPLLALMPIYFWCLVRPDLMSPAWAFLIGVLEDVLSRGPMGVWALAFVATYAVIDRQRDAFAGLSGFGAILGFSAAALVACGSAYLVLALYFWRILPLSPMLGELAMTVLFYMPIVVLLGFVHRHLVGPLRGDF
jgi:rod shape-determining protein MreD